jgi:hypothetical protein
MLQRMAFNVDWDETFRTCRWTVTNLRKLQLESFDYQGNFDKALFTELLEGISFYPPPVVLLNRPAYFDLFLRVPLPMEGYQNLRQAMNAMAKTFLVDQFYAGKRYGQPLASGHHVVQHSLLPLEVDPLDLIRPERFVASRDVLDWLRATKLQYTIPPQARSIAEAVELAQAA